MKMILKDFSLITRRCDYRDKVLWRNKRRGSYDFSLWMCCAKVNPCECNPENCPDVSVE